MTKQTKWEKEKGYQPFERREDHTLRKQLEERNKPELIDRIVRHEQNSKTSSLILLGFMLFLIIGMCFGFSYLINKTNDYWTEKTTLLSEELCQEKQLGKRLISYKFNQYHIIECEKGNIILNRGDT